jgi:hypothetical protein
MQLHKAFSLKNKSAASSFNGSESKVGEYVIIMENIED